MPGRYANFKGLVLMVSLSDHLEADVSIDKFVNDSPTVFKEQAMALSNIANSILNSKIFPQTPSLYKY